MAREALGAAEWRELGTEDSMEGGEFAHVVVGRACAVTIDVGDVGRLETCIGECLLHGEDCTFAFGRRGCLMIGVARIAVAAEHGKRPDAATKCRCLAFDDQIGCAFATGPIMQMAFTSVKFDAKNVHHQHLLDSVKVFSTHKAA